MDDERWTWLDFLALIVAVTWAVQYLAGLFVKGYGVSMEVTLAMGAVLGALGLNQPKN